MSDVFCIFVRLFYGVIGSANRTAVFPRHNRRDGMIKTVSGCGARISVAPFEKSRFNSIILCAAWTICDLGKLQYFSRL